MDTGKKNRQQLSASLEVGCIRRDLILSGVLVAAAIIVFQFRFDGISFKAGSVLVALFTAPIFGYWLWHLHQIYSSPEEYCFYHCTLTSPHQKLWTRGMMYFTVIIEDPEEGTLARDTNAIFTSYGLVGPLMEDYLNQTVTIAYNRETGMVVVIG